MIRGASARRRLNEEGEGPWEVGIVFEFSPTGKPRRTGSLSIREFAIDKRGSVVTIAKEDVQRRIQRYMPGIHDCFHQEELYSGWAKVHFTIKETGRITGLKMQEHADERFRSNKASEEEERAQTCVETRIGHWKFPRPIGGEVGVQVAFSLYTVREI